MTNIFSVDKIGREREMDKIEEYKQWGWISVPRHNHSFSMCEANLNIPSCKVSMKTVRQSYFGKTEMDK